MENYNRSFERKPFGEKPRVHGGTESRVFIGLLLVLAGVVLIAENMNMLPYHISHILVSWPMLLIALGIFNLARKSVTAGLILLAIGSYFLAPRIFDLPFNFFNNFWPILLVAVGLIFIARGKKKEEFNMIREEIDHDRIDETAIFGGKEIHIVSDNFKGGDVTAIFGGSTLDLTNTKLGENCTIDVTAIFGGVKLIIPEDWNVKIEMTSIFGGFTDKRSPSSIARVDKSKLIRIDGATIFGGGEITTMP